MRVAKPFLFLVLTLPLGVFSQSSVPAQPELESGTIESQFDYIIEKSSSFKDFQLIRRTSILKVKDNAIDSIRSIRKGIVTMEAENKELKGKISVLESEKATLKTEVENIAEGVDSIAVFGKNINKSLYNTIVWSVVIVLLLLLIFFVYRFRNGIAVTRRTKKEMEKLEMEFEEHRKKTMKKEQEIMRKLQDEINKNNI